MNAFRLITLFSIAALGVQAADVGLVIAPAKRDEAIATAQRLLGAKEILIPADFKNPFYSQAFMLASGARSVAAATPGAPAARPAGPRRGNELLEAIAAGLNPTGSFVLSGSAILMFGQKRVKAGDEMTITFEGTDYVLVITDITPPNFTFRLNNEELTRSIK
ncbi:MAG: hypothetical protein Q8J74_12975 [Candidatus Didemnitutus sp.]|nr:hypothetical protein [Candidatus Didemnitutus sp.]